MDIERIVSDVDRNIFGGYMDIFWQDLSFGFLNQRRDDAMKTDISLAGGQFTGNVRPSVVNGPDIKAENTEEKSNQVVYGRLKLRFRENHLPSHLSRI